MIATAVVVAGHVGLFMALSLSPTPPAQREPPSEPVMATLVPPSPPPPPPPPAPDRPEQKAPEPPAPAAPVKAEPEPPARTIPRLRMARTPPPPDVPTLAAVRGPANEPNVVLGEAALAGATVAGSGAGQGGDGDGTGGGGRCDMVRRLQDALRSDPDVTAAVTRSHGSLGSGGRAILVWNGQWLRSPGQDGKGLAGVRQAIAMEVAFAPAACKAQPMRGLVVISFNDGPGAPRLAIGSGTWRWSELLSARR